MTGLLQVDPCGPLYINIGDGGNREGLASNWTYPQPDWCVLFTCRFAPPQDQIASSQGQCQEALLKEKSRWECDVAVPFVALGRVV
jgi:hypothetical protein